ncbi:PorT family protein [Subsaxibacter sp. CAU 1640]|uniref:porin family protein n=1 Tax=Subsaxibacter sp. CAU 1640 TaxID=2933271 RepID=UPI002002BF23|nr:porin family protein [Subsaxibacter sp. CAU 1640]MCK7589743.1 PorT family protein [Subsaxibacter sp. CAU 1640]
MKQLCVFICVLCGFLQGFSQVERDTIQTQNDSITIVDNNYREDQFYFSLTYNLLNKAPNGLSQRGFSAGFHFGFIRDMPINERRNRAIGVGVGLSSNSYNQNMLIAEQPDGEFNYSIIDEDSISFNKNKFTTYLVEVPLEIRWRTSTATEYQFWRIYTGVKFGYVLLNSSKFDGSIGKIKNSNIDDVVRFRYGLTFSAGYSTWNAHIYYGLNSLFDKPGTINGEALNMTSIKVGLIFYIL